MLNEIYFNSLHQVNLIFNLKSFRLYSKIPIFIMRLDRILDESEYRSQFLF